MRSLGFVDFLIGVGILFVLEGVLFAASPAFMPSFRAAIPFLPPG